MRLKTGWSGEEMIELSLDGAAGPTHVSIAGRALILLHPLLPTEAPSSQPENA